MIQDVLIFLILLMSIAALEVIDNDRCLDQNLNGGKCTKLEDSKTVREYLRPSVRKCKEYSNSDLKTNLRRNETIFIRCGNPTTITTFPHMVVLGWRYGTSYEFKCGGSLISHNFVLTAAHCLLDRDWTPPVIVRLAYKYLDIDIAVASTKSHPKYDSPIRYYDIGLIKLNESVEFTKFMRPACLWTRDDFDGYDSAIATGWGVTNSENTEQPTSLQEATLSLISNEICNITLESLINKNWINGFSDTQMCAGNTGNQINKDTCAGDSGGPLQIRDRNNSRVFYVIGVTAFGNKVCGPKPAVYTRVSKFVDWIESVVWPEEA